MCAYRSQIENLRCYVVGRIRTLHIVDGHTVTQNEASEAIRNVVSSHLTLATLLNHAHANTTPLPSLSVLPIARVLAVQHPTPHTDWCSKVGRPARRLQHAGSHTMHLHAYR